MISFLFQVRCFWVFFFKENLAEQVKISEAFDMFTASNMNNSTSGIMVQTFEHRIKHCINAH